VTPAPASTRDPRRHRCRGGGAVIAAVAAALLVLVVPGATAPPAEAAPATAPALRLASQPVSVGPDDPFIAFLQVEGAPSGSELVVDIYDRVTDPAQVGAEPSHSAATFEPIPLGDARPGVNPAAFKIELYSEGHPRPDSASAWKIDRAGVYPIRVKLQDADGHVLTTLVTQLVRRPGPDETVRTAHVAVVARVHRDPGPAPDTALPTRFSRHLDRFLGALRTHASLPATFAVTPETAARMATDPDAKPLYGRLRTEVRRKGRELLDAPYVDIDPPSLVAAGLAGELSRQRDLGRDTLKEFLGEPSTGSWRMDRPLDTASLTAMRGRGIFRLLVSADTLKTPPQAPTRLAAGDGEVRAIPIDHDYSLDPSTSGGDPILAAHRLLARLAASADNADTEQAIVLSVDTATVDALALPALFDGLIFGAPFFTAETVDQLYDAPEAAGTQELVPSTPRDLGATGQLAVDTQASLDSYSSMIPDQPELVARYQRPMAVAASVDLSEAERRTRLNAIQATLDRRLGAVSTPAKDKVTVGARNARFPLTITSSLRYPVQVVIDLDSPDRLKFPHNHFAQTVEPGRTVIQIRVHTKASGDTPVRITLRTPDRRVVLTESQYTIRSTVVSGIGLVLTVGAAAFLALWWGRHVAQARRTPKHARRGRSGRDVTDGPPEGSKPVQPLP
jgi:hypothetical protein